MQNTARLEKLLERRMVSRIVNLFRLLFGIEVIEVAVEFVETVKGWQIFVTVPQMVFANLGGHVTLWLEQLGQRGIFRLDSLWRAGHADGCQTGPHRDLPGNQGSAPGRAAG